jgi:NAD(P)-dependent dehydrogenase (short-subunit alcohol dehydrogenase family)
VTWASCPCWRRSHNERSEHVVNQDFSGRTIIITGGTGGLGSAVVRTFVEAGATCHVTYRESRDLESFDLRDRVTVHQSDVSDEPTVTALYQKIPTLWASIHLVGAFAMSPVEKTSTDDFLKMFRTNALSCFLCCREAIKQIRTTGAGGRIVNVGARPAVTPVGGMVSYSTSKAAVVSLTQSLAEETKPDRIWINAVLPSVMDTPANRKSMPDADFAKWPKVEQVAQTITFLASPANALTTGAAIPVYGAA